MVTFWDTDVLLKLAAMNLLNETLDLLGVGSDAVYLTPSAPHYLRKKRNLEKRYGAAGLERARQFVKTAQTISDYSEDELDALSQINDIDAGEAILIAATSASADFLLLTGDKRALQALAQYPSCVAIAQRLTRKVVCLEQIVLRLAQLDFEQARAKIVPARDCDSAIKVAFGSGIQATQENVQHALRGYIEDLRQQTGDMLIDW